MNEHSSQHHKRRQTRLKRLNLGILAWVVAFALALYGWWLGQLDMTVEGFGLIGALVLLFLLGNHVAIRSGWSERFRDPSMTLVHMLVAVPVSLYIIAQAGDTHALFLLLFIIVAFFGVFQLRKEEFALFSVASVVGYGFILLGEFLESPSGDNRVLLLEFGVFAIVMFWLAFIGSYVADMRRRLSQKNRELEEVSGHLKHLSEHDELTGLPNRRQLISNLERAAEESSDGGPGFSVAELDLDNFKRINDRYGHQAGDEVLAELAQRAAAELRGADAVMRVDETVAEFGRFGGEEFLALLPETDLDGARRAAERLRKAIAESPFETSAGPIDCSASIGVAQHRPGESVNQTIARADEALYSAKHNGRNRVAAA